MTELDRLFAELVRVLRDVRPDQLTHPLEVAELLGYVPYRTVRAAIGTETDGSIVSPASRNGLVGLKPTVGLISRDGIIPLGLSLDTGGPMTRSVSDIAVSLGAMTGVIGPCSPKWAVGNLCP